ncbi:MAG: NAD(P)-dependent oxidoreductase [bacterium]|nr:NAD(P)-dependent oxidoreductase [bacterium]
MAKILVTGGAGYIGSILVPELLRHGHAVTVIDNFMFHQTSLLDCCHDKNLTIVQGDARDTALVRQHTKDVEYIFPLACLVGAPLCDRDPWTARSLIKESMDDLIFMLHDDQRIIYPTTNSGYGSGQGTSYCTEESPLHPVSLYARLKIEAEKKALTHPRAITLRLATVFGISPRMRLDLLVNDFVHRAVKDNFIVLFEAHRKRNFIHIRDVVRAFLHCMDNFEAMNHQTYNVGLSNANLSKEELCLKIKEQLPNFYFINAEIGEDPDKRDYIVSNAKIEATGFKPIFSIQDGIAELIKGYQIIRQNQFSNA